MAEEDSPTAHEVILQFRMPMGVIDDAQEYLVEKSIPCPLKCTLARRPGPWVRIFCGTMLPTVGGEQGKR